MVMETIFYGCVDEKGVEDMMTTCEYNRITSKSPTLNDCDRCSEENRFPYDWCCLHVCGTHELCVTCTRRRQ